MFKRKEKHVTDSDAIRSLPSSDVTIKFTGEIKPFVVCSNEYPNLLHVILPVKLISSQIPITTFLHFWPVSFKIMQSGFMPSK